MLRRQVLIGAVGLVLSAAAVCADVPKQVQLFGNTYNVTVNSRVGTFKNGVQIAAQTPTDDVPDTKQKANLAFVPGADPSADRLFVVAPMGDQDAVLGDQFYLLTGADANGVFNTTNSNATQFFGGSVDRNRGGRPNTVTFISDVDTGLKKDRNIVVTTFTGDDHFRFYDLDTLKGDYLSDAVLSIKVPRIAQTAGEDPSPGMPNSGWLAGALGPNGTLVVVARTEGDSSMEIGVMDPTKDQFFNVKTDLAEATASGANPIDPPNQIPTALARMAENEYWLLTSELDQGGNLDNAGQQYIYRLRLTFPANLATAEPGSIQVEVLGREDLTAKTLHQSEGGIFGMTSGREVSPGLRVVYMADWIGNLLTLTPVAPTTPPAAGP
jgi:hypothetical protein